MRIFYTLLWSLLYFPLLAQISPIQLGRSSNAIESNMEYHGIYTQQNMVFASDSLDMVSFIHRQDVTIYGGGSVENGKFRYDLSIDGGATFLTDIGSFQWVYQSYGRTPQMLSHIPAGTTDPLNTKLVWAGHTNRFPTPGFIGKVVGCANTSTSGPIATTEHYLDDILSTHIPGGLSQGLVGEFWMAEQMHGSSDFMDSLMIHKGIYNPSTGDVNWSIHKVVYVPHFRSGSKAHASIPNLAFSPDGMIGWVAFAGDLIGGIDSVYQPVVLKTTDGGVSWSSPSEISLSAFTIVADSMFGSPEAGMDPEFDLSVDANNNLHFFTHVYASSNYEHHNYPLGVVPWHAMLDITTSNGGVSWQAEFVSAAFAYTGDFGMPNGNGNLLEHRLQPQISRTEDGQHIFYAWIDQDTSIVGYGELSLLSPNLRTAALDVSTGTRTVPEKVTDNDLIWDGQAMFPTLAPTVIQNGTDIHLPLVMMEMINNDQDQPCRYWYFGNDLTYVIPNTVVQSVENSKPNFTVFPNPSSGLLQLKALNHFKELRIQLLDIQGRMVFSKKYRETNNIHMNLNSIPVGIYFVKIYADHWQPEVLKWIKY